MASKMAEEVIEKLWKESLDRCEKCLDLDEEVKEELSNLDDQLRDYAPDEIGEMLDEVTDMRRLSFLKIKGAVAILLEADEEGLPEEKVMEGVEMSFSAQLAVFEVLALVKEIPKPAEMG